MDILGLIGKLLGKKEQPVGGMMENPNIVSPLSPRGEMTKGFENYKRMNLMNMNAPRVSGATGSVNYPESLANAPRRGAKPSRVLGERSSRSMPTPTSTPVPDPGTFWEEFTNLVREEAGLRGYNPDVLIKQKALESGFGTSRFAKERNNFGGIGAYTENPEAAFTFESPQDYLQAYFDLIEERFPQAYENRQDPKKYLQGLLKGTHGTYATDPDYVNKVLATPLLPR